MQHQDSADSRLRDDDRNEPGSHRDPAIMYRAPVRDLSPARSRLWATSMPSGAMSGGGGW